MIHLLGLNSFIGKNFYFLLKKKKVDVMCYSHNDIDLMNVIEHDIIINFCGVNKANEYNEYEYGNFLFLKNIIEKIKDKNVFVIHISSLAVNGFTDCKMEDLSKNMQYFIETKLKGEQFLIDKCDSAKLLIIRPSNIYGYNCEPYYNNILVSLMHDKINNLKKINDLNKNCIRNYLSVEGLVNKIYELMETKTFGIYNVISNNNIDLEKLCNYVYKNKPEYINLNNDNFSISNINFNNNIVVYEDIVDLITKLEIKMKNYINLKNDVVIDKLDELVQSRGNMIEISNIESKRLYKITLTKNSIRGNHYHDVQVEDFFINKGYVYFFIAEKNNLDIVYQFKLHLNEKVQVKPNLIHTLVNDFADNEPEIFVCSTQKYIKNLVLDTSYVNLI